MAPHATPSAPRFAQGWYLIAWSVELGAGAVQAVRAFARDFVLYRTEAGQATLLDAFCPHLGAHLGHGGKVVGEELACPFHGWRFGTGGRCARIPYARRVPPQAAVRAYPVREHGGMILAYWSEAPGEPPYEVPEAPELGDPAWTALARAEIEIATQPREIIENIADVAHFKPVHNMKIDHFEVIIDGPRATQRTVGKGRNLAGQKIDVETIAINHGPAVQFTRLGWAFPMFLVNAHLPLDDRRLLLRFGVSLRAPEGVVLPPQVLEAHVAAARDGYFQDVAIWEHKAWRDRPLLADGDGPIAKVRRWYAAFSEDPGGVGPARARPEAADGDAAAGAAATRPKTGSPSPGRVAR